MDIHKNARLSLRRSLAKKELLRATCVDSPSIAAPLGGIMFTVRQNDRMPMYLKTVDFFCEHICQPMRFILRIRQRECRRLARGG
jgi:hypothetical protein